MKGLLLTYADVEVYEDSTWGLDSVAKLLGEPPAHTWDVPLERGKTRLVAYYGISSTRATLHHVPRPSVILSMDGVKVVSMTVFDLLRMSTLHVLEEHIGVIGVERLRRALL